MIAKKIFVFSLSFLLIVYFNNSLASDFRRDTREDRAIKSYEDLRSDYIRYSPEEQEVIAAGFCAVMIGTGTVLLYNIKKSENEFNRKKAPDAAMIKRVASELPGLIKTMKELPIKKGLKSLPLIGTALASGLFVFDSLQNGAEAATLDLISDLTMTTTLADSSLGPYFISSPERFMEFMELDPKTAESYILSSPTLVKAFEFLSKQKSLPANNSLVPKKRGTSSR